MRTLAPLLFLVGGCATEEEAEPTVELLDARGQLIRLSMDLRGIHPTEVELWAFENAPEPEIMYDSYAEAWIEDPRFLDRIKEIFNERYLLRTGDVYFDTSDMPGLSGIDDRRMADIIANEAFSLLEYVILNDLP
ncbi:MAG TPA: hypothetical protein ENK18_27070, partial [Deltaproteobacteria bacterium]|nr:hypothetical protein [Deltaproteobacteria bacterium]